MTNVLPAHTTLIELAAHLKVPVRTLREKVKALGAYSKIGKQMILFESDVQQIMEATRPCHSKSTSAAKSGTTGAPLQEGDYAALRKLRTKQSRNELQPNGKGGNGRVISMDRGQH